MKIAIAYGWAEGPWQGKKLRRKLREAGFDIVKSLDNADVIIAHSGGCFLLPKNLRASLIMLVGMPYWPGLHPTKSLRNKIKYEVKDFWWLRKTMFNIIYFLTKPMRWVRMWLNWKRFELPFHEKNPIIAVRNKDDHFIHPVAVNELASEKGWKLDVMPGGHDDLWINPEPYVLAIKKELARDKA